MNKIFEWTVIGAGPAGIAGVGKLLDAGVNSSQIAWIDPNFALGDFNRNWGHVMSNTPVEMFGKFYRHSKAFRYSQETDFIIDKSSPDKNCPLMIAAQPLQWISNHLRERVTALRDEVCYLKPKENLWQVELASGTSLKSEKLILAIGGIARELEFAGTVVIPLKVALNPLQIKQEITANDYVVVFGSAQSAKSVVENLARIKTRKNILFYRREDSLNRHLRHNDLNHMEILAMTPQNLFEHMPHCTKVIYAIGFRRRHIPILGLPSDYGYDKKTGEIAPGVFGLGMAFPEIMPYELGQIEYKVTAIWPFMRRLDKLLPLWLGAKIN